MVYPVESPFRLRQFRRYIRAAQKMGKPKTVLP